MYGLTPQKQEKLLLSQHELTFIWTTREGHAILHQDQATKEWFYPDFACHARSPTPTPEAFVAFLDTPARIIIEVVPEKSITFDGGVMRDTTTAALQTYVSPGKAGGFSW